MVGQTNVARAKAKDKSLIAGKDDKGEKPQASDEEQGLEPPEGAEEAAEGLGEMFGLLSAKVHGHHLWDSAFRFIVFMGMFACGGYTINEAQKYLAAPNEWIITHDRIDEKGFDLPTIDICGSDFGTDGISRHGTLYMGAVRWKEGVNVSELGSGDLGSGDLHTCKWADVFYATPDSEMRYYCDQTGYDFKLETSMDDTPSFIKYDDETKCFTVNGDENQPMPKLDLKDGYVVIDIPFYFDPPGAMDLAMVSVYARGTSRHSPYARHYPLQLNSMFTAGLTMATEEPLSTTAYSYDVDSNDDDDDRKRDIYELKGTSFPGLDFSHFSWFSSYIYFTGIHLVIKPGSKIVVSSKQQAKNPFSVFAELGGIWGAYMMALSAFYIALPHRKGRVKEFVFRYRWCFVKK